MKKLKKFKFDSLQHISNIINNIIFLKQQFYDIQARKSNFLSRSCISRVILYLSLNIVFQYCGVIDQNNLKTQNLLKEIEKSYNKEIANSVRKHIESEIWKDINTEEKFDSVNEENTYKDKEVLIDLLKGKKSKISIGVQYFKSVSKDKKIVNKVFRLQDLLSWHTTQLHDKNTDDRNAVIEFSDKYNIKYVNQSANSNLCGLNCIYSLLLYCDQKKYFLSAPIPKYMELQLLYTNPVGLYAMVVYPFERFHQNYRREQLLYSNKAISRILDCKDGNRGNLKIMNEEGVEKAVKIIMQTNF